MAPHCPGSILAREERGVEPSAACGAVAGRHQAHHVLFVRPCASCAGAFDYCGSCQPGRRYCGDRCGAGARSASVRRAQARYNDRASEEGRQAHRLEEADRRARRSAEVVGDHRCHGKSGELRALPSTAPHAVAEVFNAASVHPVSPPPVREPREGAPAPERLEWVLVAWPELLGAARRRAGTEVRCPFCGRHGRVVEVISIDQWRRRPRRGLGLEP